MINIPFHKKAELKIWGIHKGKVNRAGFQPVRQYTRKLELPFITLIMLLFFLASCDSPETGEKKNIKKQTDSHFREGRKAMKHENFEEMIRHLSEAIALAAISSRQTP